jgi:hypothetical protein
VNDRAYIADARASGSATIREIVLRWRDYVAHRLHYAPPGKPS